MPHKQNKKRLSLAVHKMTLWHRLG